MFGSKMQGEGWALDYLKRYGRQWSQAEVMLCGVWRLGPVTRSRKISTDNLECLQLYDDVLGYRCPHPQTEFTITRRGATKKLERGRAD